MNSNNVKRLAFVLMIGVIILSVGCGKEQTKETKKKVVDTSGIVNIACPIMNNKIDPKNVPANLTREWEGQKIGFCCGGCPEKWDKLSDKDKEEKLSKVLSKSAKDAVDHSGHNH